MWPAPAKINLFLRVLRRRDDGYHELQTLFQFVDLADTLTVEATRDGRIRRLREIPRVAEADDLTVRAAQALRRRFGVTLGATIAVDKRIPRGAGLGGGSSDAATVLLVLNRLWGLDASVAELAQVGLALGADVPVFVHGEAALGEGIGERLTPCAPPQRNYLLVVPPVEVDTRRVFRAFALTADEPPIRIECSLGDAAGNDLEPITRALYPPVDEALRWLRRHGKARMSGSGGAVFLPLETQDEGIELLGRLPEGCTGHVVRGLNRHPLHGALTE